MEGAIQPLINNKGKVGVAHKNLAVLLTAARIQQKSHGCTPY